MIQIDKLIEKIILERNKTVDNLILGEIQKIATENGFDTKVVLNEKAIVSALEKQIPKKPLNPCGRWGGKSKGGNCPVCGAHTTENVSKFCRKCGQALDWSDI